MRMLVCPTSPNTCFGLRPHTREEVMKTALKDEGSPQKRPDREWAGGFSVSAGVRF
jgi:hypothetical protein